MTTRDLSYDTFEACGVEERANRYDARGELLHGPIPNASATIAATEIIFSFPRQSPTARDLMALADSGFKPTGRSEFTGPRMPYGNYKP